MRLHNGVSPEALQKHLLDICPTVYGTGSLPIILLAVTNSLLLLLATYNTFIILPAGKWKSNFARYVLIILILLFLLQKSFFFFVPFKWNFFGALFICDQIPRFFYFGAWEFLSIWLGNSILKTPRDKAWLRVLFHGTYTIIMTLVLVFSCVTSIIRHYMDDSSFHLGYLTFLSNSVMYLTVSTSLFTNFYRLIRIYFDASLDRSYKKRLGMLVSMVGIVFSIQTIRFGYALLKVMKLNVLHNGIEMKRMECATNDISNSKSCVAFSWYYSLLHLFFDFLPTGLLLVTFNLLNSQGSAKRKTRPKKYLDTHSDASKSPTSAHRSGGGVDTPQTSINSVHPYPKNKPRKPARKRPQRRAIRYDTVPDIEEDFVMVP